ncbi:MAG: helix-turn-helix domain-containing protein [Clostridia bacterium]|jgi:transcriptional regulator, XRE family
MLGDRIKLLREEKHLRQEELAKDLSVAPSTIGMYETNKRQPNNDLIIKLAKYFNVSTDYLLGKSDIRNPEEQIKQEFEFAYHKEMEGLSDEEIADALRFYKQIKYGNKENKSDN